MALTCNIDARGKAARLRIGIVLTLAGLGGLALLAVVSPVGTWAWAVVLGLLGSGAFTIFEARAGWCVVRALGFRTPI